jgi:hypothetical protein
MGYMLSTFIEKALRDLEAANPTLCETISLADSPGGKPITAIALSDPDQAVGIPVLVIGGVHAREWAPPDSLVGFVTRLLTARASGADIVYPAFTTGGITYSDPNYRVAAAEVARIFERFRLIVLPLVNPDGRDVSLLGTSQMWRKNRRDVRDPAEGLPPSCIGVDINRNFPIAWNHLDFYRPDAAKDANLSTNKCAFQRYKGPGAGSETETQNVMTLATNNSLGAFVDVHMSGRTITYPWGIERNQTLTPSQRFDDAGYNHLPAIAASGRDGLRGNSYGEYIPDYLLARLDTVAKAMAKEIEDSAGASPVAQARSKYATMNTTDANVHWGFPKETVWPGGSDDYVLSLQFLDDARPSCLAYTVEAGMHPEGRKDNPFDDDGGFFPHFDKQLPKIEREIHAALFGLLKAL